ncbi:hypothetical protein H0I76_16755 [Limibaculum sp. M0105]|uniref:Uncharacterized protein n=1 Tax=Thermohalobaculum xanthum TaxID=2753746 RepID=A0A8J7M9V5_9RHOB|nr:hypothetical protein [Thermohalobaculum xanthum]MBK0400853.1 hypothetical protein [Thermohalobaculum xanthum]
MNHRFESFSGSTDRIAEFDAAGGLLREYAWLDDKPLAVIEDGRTFHVRLRTRSAGRCSRPR